MPKTHDEVLSQEGTFKIPPPLKGDFTNSPLERARGVLFITQQKKIEITEH